MTTHNGPPKEGAALTSGTGRNGSPTTTPTSNNSTTYCRLRLRREASWRLPALASGRADPWHYEPIGARGYAQAVAHLLGEQLTAAPNRMP